MFEKKTLLNIYDSNSNLGYEEFCDKLDSWELLKLCGFLDLIKKHFLKRIDDNVNTSEIDEPLD